MTECCPNIKYWAWVLVDTACVVSACFRLAAGDRPPAHPASRGYSCRPLRLCGSAACCARALLAPGARRPGPPSGFARRPPRGARRRAWVSWSVPVGLALSFPPWPVPVLLASFGPPGSPPAGLCVLVGGLSARACGAPVGGRGRPPLVLLVGFLLAPLGFRPGPPVRPWLRVPVGLCLSALCSGGSVALRRGRFLFKR